MVRTLRVDFNRDDNEYKIVGPGVISAPRVAAGVEWKYSLVVSDRGSKKDLTGFTAEAKVRAQRKGSSAELLTVTATISVTTGSVVLSLTPTQTTSNRSLRGWLEVTLKNASGTAVARLMEGIFEIDD